jgi:phytoene desaturase
VIAAFSFLGIMLGVATLIVVMSVMNGFRAELLDKIVGINGHIFLQATDTPLTDFDAIDDRIRKVSGVKLVIPMIEGAAGVSSQYNQAGALIRGMAALFTRLGGEIRLNAPIDAITTQGDRVTAVVSKGETLAVDMVASNGDVVHTYRDLMSGNRRGPKEGARLAGKRHSMSPLVVYFGLSKLHEQLAHHTVCFGPRYQELIGEIFRGPELAADFSLYLHSPCVTDPSLSPPGGGAYYVLAPVPHLGAAAIDWEREGPLYRDRILDYLEARYMPGLRDQLVGNGLKSYTESVSTPQGLRTRVRLGPFTSREAADRARQKLKTMKLDGSVVPP